MSEHLLLFIAGAGFGFIVFSVLVELNYQAKRTLITHIEKRKRELSRRALGAPRWSASPAWKEAGYTWPETESDSERGAVLLQSLPSVTADEVSDHLKSHLVRGKLIDERYVETRFSGINLNPVFKKESDGEQ